MKCAHCDEEHTEVYVHSRCHPMVPSWIKLNTADKTLTIICTTCWAETAVFQLSDLDEGLGNAVAHLHG